MCGSKPVNPPDNKTMNPLIRLTWFLLVGWWLGLIWLFFAMLISLTIIGLPVGMVMGWYTPKIMFLP